MPVLFFPLTILYEELLLRLCGVDTAAFDYRLLYPVAFSIVSGLVLWAPVNLIRSRKVRTAVSMLLTFGIVFIFCAEFICKQFFKTFFELNYMLKMSGSVTNDFASQTVTAIIDGVPYIISSLIPLLLLWIYRKQLIPADTAPRKGILIAVAAAAALELAVVAVILSGAGPLSEDKDYFTSDYSANAAISNFGMMASTQLEVTYGIFGVPAPSFDDAQEIQPTPEPDPEYDYNVMDINFEQLKTETKDDTLLSMHQYFSSLAPTQQNEYTGMFKDKNLVYVVAEAFSPYVIDPDLTPTLYKMTTESFVFNNFYQPDWRQSTTGGEFASLTGLVPTHVDGSLSFVASAKKAMPLALGNQFSKLGYACRAYHNNSYNFYDRDKTHPNLGYDYYGIGNGLDMKIRSWPASDVEMFDKTMDEYINNYVTNGEKFHTYYMTVSGHALYHWNSNSQSRNHRDEVEAFVKEKGIKYSTTVKSYLACQLEVEYALRHLLEKLEAAGIADDTVIALTSDHYPYGMSNEYKELEPVKTEDTEMARYKNTFLLYCSSMEEPVIVNDPASTIDILPTLSNLFGLEYDSRLFSGRDLLSSNYSVSDPNSPQPFVISANAGNGYSWISLAGSYNSYTKEFTPAPGFEGYAEDSDYISAMSKKAKNMTTYAKYMIQKNYYDVVLGEKEVVDPSDQPQA